MVRFITFFFLALCFVGSVFARDFIGPPENRKAQQHLDAFAHRVAKTYGMDYVTTGLGSIIDTPKVVYCIGLMDRRPMTVEQARPMAVKIYDAFWSTVSTDPAYAADRQYLARVYPKTSDPSIHPGLIGVKIAYWDENTDRRLQPYLAQINVAEGKVSYFFANRETQALEPPVVESIDEARKKIERS